MRYVELKGAEFAGFLTGLGIITVVSAAGVLLFFKVCQLFGEALARAITLGM